jgi:CYTH domain-containing protein
MLEIERKFLVRQMPDNLEHFARHAIAQGYLVPSGEVEVRLRRQDDQHWLTFKRRSGLVREEINLPLTGAQWDELWPLTLGKRLTKLRYEIPLAPWTVEIDVYGGKNEGIVVAEVEFPSEEEAMAFQPPDWLGEEVTGRREYANPLLAIE